MSPSQMAQGRDKKAAPYEFSIRIRNKLYEKKSCKKEVVQGLQHTSGKMDHIFWSQ